MRVHFLMLPALRLSRVGVEEEAKSKAPVLRYAQREQKKSVLHPSEIRYEKESIPTFYAEAGLWYDALSALATLIDMTPSESDFHAQRTALLEQVGLQAVAAYER